LKETLKEQESKRAEGDYSGVRKEENIKKGIK
jgi:hypothetical protein